MLRYDWTALKKYSNNDLSKILDYMKVIDAPKEVVYSFKLENEWVRKMILNGVSRNNYLLNFEGLLRNRLRGSKEELFVYLDLCSYRNSFNYFNTNGRVKDLPIWKISNTYDIDKLKANRLLEIDENNIHFIYEEEEIE